MEKHFPKTMVALCVCVKEGQAYRVFDWEVHDYVLIIRHLPRTQSQHVSVL